ncbi:hypothetical protein FB451DRAFT_1249334 [Mycena latifolia]|nr:hypothetical protein FB451DRAFT_1249334 [Mycena latifolia]
MASPLDATMGAWLISLFLASILYGIALLQAYLYFFWYTKDHWGIKTIITSLLIFETLHITLFFYGAYAALIDNFGNFERINEITCTDSTHLAAGFVSAFLVQMYFAYCIYTLSPKYRIMPICIVILALLQLGSGIAQTVTTMQLGLFSLLDKTKSTTTIQAVSTLACDMGITACLCFTLDSKRSGMKTTDSLVNMLMINAVNRGMLTAFAAALNLVLFFTVPHTFWFFIGLIPSSKLYMNSMLATLNTRQHIRDRAIANNSIPIGTLNRSQDTPQAVQSSSHSSQDPTKAVGHLFPTDYDDDRTHRKSAFTVEVV